LQKVQLQVHDKKGISHKYSPHFLCSFIGKYIYISPLIKGEIKFNYIENMRLEYISDNIDDIYNDDDGSSQVQKLGTPFRLTGRK
jgi:hypothetical protein